MSPRVDYERRGHSYARFRRTDPRIAERIHAALRDARTVLNHWEPPEAGLAELRRVARGPVVVFTFELDSLPTWHQGHLAEGLAIERRRFPSMTPIAAALGGRVRVERVPTPGGCVDGFFEAFWRRPEAFARSRCSGVAVDLGAAGAGRRGTDRGAPGRGAGVRRLGRRAWPSSNGGRRSMAPCGWSSPKVPEDG
jgi:hypothetical protein